MWTLSVDDVEKRLVGDPIISTAMIVGG